MSVRRKLNRAELKEFQAIEWEEAERIVGAGYAQRFAPVHTQIELFKIERKNAALRREIAERRARPINGRVVFGRAVATFLITILVAPLIVYLPLSSGGRDVRFAIAEGIAMSKFDPAHPPTFDILLADVPPEQRTVPALLEKRARRVARVEAVEWRDLLAP